MRLEETIQGPTHFLHGLCSRAKERAVRSHPRRWKGCTRALTLWSFSLHTTDLQRAQSGPRLCSKCKVSCFWFSSGPCFVLAADPPDYVSLGGTWLGGLIKAPVVRQFLHNGHLYKEEEERAISHFELFADLVFVAVIHVSRR